MDGFEIGGGGEHAVGPADDVGLVAAILGCFADLLGFVVFLFAVFADEALADIADEFFLVGGFHFAGGHGGGWVRGFDLFALCAPSFRSPCARCARRHAGCVCPPKFSHRGRRGGLGGVGGGRVGRWGAMIRRVGRFRSCRGGAPDLFCGMR